MKIGYLGPPGTYCQEAMEVFCQKKEYYKPIQFPSIYDALNAVCCRSVDHVVVPIENSIEGSVNATLDFLAENTELKIKGEIILPISHTLVIKSDTNIQDIELILSHPQALAQCSKYLHERFRGIMTRVALSTAEAAREVAESEGKWAAVANSRVTDIYNLKIADANIQDGLNNVTRFIVVSLEDNKRTGKDKTSIVFSAEDKPGSLYRILDIFNLWDINLTKIESRPAKNELGKYIFFVDFEGHRNEQDIKDALTMVNRKTSIFRIIGSYPCLN